VGKQQKFSQEAIRFIQQDTVAKHLKLRGETTKRNPENKQSQILGSTQAKTVSQHTSISSKFSAITTAQYAN